MLYIDLDGVLANVEKYIYKIGGLKAIEDPCTFIRICAEHCNTVFLESELIPSSLLLIKDISDFRILSSLPHLNKFIEFNREFYDSRTLSEKYSQLRYNKIEWVKKHLGDECVSKLILVNDSNEKVMYCLNNGDVLYDDYMKTIDAWSKKGGIGVHIPFVRDFL